MTLPVEGVAVQEVCESEQQLFFVHIFGPDEACYHSSQSKEPVFINGLSTSTRTSEIGKSASEETIPMESGGGGQTRNSVISLFELFNTDHYWKHSYRQIFLTLNGNKLQVVSGRSAKDGRMRGKRANEC